MIKATLVFDGKPAAVLGLSGENMARLMADEPIVIDLADMGLPPQIVIIIGGKDENAIAADLEAAYGAARSARAARAALGDTP